MNAFACAVCKTACVSALPSHRGFELLGQFQLSWMERCKVSKRSFSDRLGDNSGPDRGGT